ncbi:MAG: hypothetical protein AB7T86_12860 [Xanthobacteraceae bacterium]|uniref:hypothetical protein n=1 Tax=Pseudolabrys sp. TaxID=1960880 RepID=UPI003D0EF640
MQRSIYLARLIGPPLVAAGVGVLFNGDVFRAIYEQFVISPALLYLSGAIVLPVGIAIVLAHNLWVKDWRVIVTVFGWLMVIGGVARMVAPQLAQIVGGAVIDTPYTLPVSGVAIAALGCVLSYCGYADLDKPAAAAETKSPKPTGQTRSATRRRNNK